MSGSKQLPKPLTPEDVRLRLGLLPWDEQAARMYEQHMARARETGEDASSLRRSGRTWAMLCEVVAALSAGKTVLLVAHSVRYAEELKQQALAWAAECGIHTAEIRPLPDRQAWDERVFLGVRDRAVFWDHDVFSVERRQPDSAARLRRESLKEDWPPHEREGA